MAVFKFGIVAPTAWFAIHPTTSSCPQVVVQKKWIEDGLAKAKS
jgi:hypothetical protein